jgi:hypothetical protein
MGAASALEIGLEAQLLSVSFFTASNYRYGLVAMITLQDLTVGQVSGMIAAAVFIGRS